MKDKILNHLGPKNAARLSAKIEELKRADAFEEAETMARKELADVPNVTEDDIVDRAAVRLQQLLGCIVRQPRPVPVAPAPVPVVPAAEVEPAPAPKPGKKEKVEPSTESAS